MALYVPRPQARETPPNHPLWVHGFAAFAYFACFLLIDKFDLWGFILTTFVVGGLFTLVYDRWQPCLLWSTLHIFILSTGMAVVDALEGRSSSLDTSIFFVFVIIPVFMALAAAGIFSARLAARMFK